MASTLILVCGRGAGIDSDDAVDSFTAAGPASPGALPADDITRHQLLGKGTRDQYGGAAR